MNVIIYENNDLVIYFSYITCEFYKQTSVTDLQEITYKDVIELLSIMPDKSKAEKMLKIIEAGKMAGIISEVA